MLPEENNPVLCDGSDADVHTSLTVSDTKPTPLPKLQIFILYLTLFSEPITGIVIYPFINQFVRETGITQGDEHKTGYYAGIIVRQQLRYTLIQSSLFLAGICILLCRMLYGCTLGLFVRSVWA